MTLMRYVFVPVFAVLLIADGYARDAIMSTPAHDAYTYAVWAGLFMAVVWAVFKSTTAITIAGLCVVMFFLDYYRDMLAPYVLAVAYLVFVVTVARIVYQRR